MCTWSTSSTLGRFPRFRGSHEPTNPLEPWYRIPNVTFKEVGAWLETLLSTPRSWLLDGCVVLDSETNGNRSERSLRCTIAPHNIPLFLGKGFADNTTVTSWLVADIALVRGHVD